MFTHVSVIPPLFQIIVLFSAVSPLWNRCRRHAPPTDAVSCDASHGSKRRLPWFYLEEAGKLFNSINLCTEPCCACHRENKQMHIFCLWLFWMMDYSAKIAVIIGKPLTFRHYPYPYTLYRTLDMGYRIYSIRGTYAAQNKRSLNSTRLALRLSFSYIYFCPHFPWFPAFLFFFFLLHTKV